MAIETSTSPGLRVSSLAPPARTPWRTALGATTGLGLLAGIRVALVYPFLGRRVAWEDALASGLLEGWTWLPLVPLLVWTMRLRPPAVGLPAAACLHVACAAGASFVHLALFAATSGLVRNLRFGDAFRVDLASPLFSMLVPGMTLYALVLLGAWWWSGERPRLQAADEELTFRAGRGELSLRPSEIDWIRAAGNYLELHAGSSVHLVRETLSGLYARLGEEDFQRIHRSVLVRRAAIQAVRRGNEAEVTLQDGTRLSVGRTFRKTL